MRRTRKGFTLVELLILVAIWGILSAAMMVATQNATAKARANQIAIDLKTIASGVAVYCADDDTPTLAEFITEDTWNKYLFGTKKANYTVAADGTDDTRWIATYNVALEPETETQMDKIKEAAGITIDTDKKASMRVR